MQTTILKKNIKVLEQYYADYAKRLLRIIGEERKSTNIEVLVDYYLERTLLSVRYDGKKYQLESAYDNDLFTSAAFKNVGSDWELNGKMFFFGFGNGMYVRKFLETFSEDHDIFVYEPFEEIFMTVIKYIDISDLIANKRVHLFIDYDDNKVRYDTVLKMLLDYTDIFTFRYRLYLNYGTLFKEKANSWITMINDALNTINADHILYMRFGELFLENNYSNYKYFINSKKLLDLQNSVSDNIPAIIVASGPSLSKNVNELKKAEGRSIIIALDASVNPLLRAGIHPDIIIAVDPIKGEKYLSEKGASSIPLVCDINTAKGLLQAHKSLKFFTYGFNMFVNEFLQKCDIKMPILEAGGSVANSAFSFARFLGCKKIILVGQDLAFTGNKTHVEGSVRGSEGRDYIEDSVKYKIVEEDIYGNPILSCAEYRSFRLWFESQIIFYSDIEVIDATEGGAKINGTKIMTLKNALKECCNEEFDFKTVLDGSSDLLTYDQKSKFREHIGSIINRIEENEVKIKKAKSIYKKMNALVRNGEAKSRKMIKLGREVNKIVDEIQDDASMSSMRDIATKEIGELLSEVYKMESTVDEELLAVSNIGIEYLSDIEESIEKFKEIHNFYVKNESFTEG